MADTLSEYSHKCRVCKHRWTDKHFNGDDAKKVQCPECESTHTTADKTIFLDKAPDLEAAFDEAKNSFKSGDTAEKVSSTAKLAGKSLFGAALLIGEIGASLVKGVAQSAPKLLDSDTWKDFGNSYNEFGAKKMATAIVSGRAPDGSNIQLSSEQRCRFEENLLSAKNKIETSINEEKERLSRWKQELQQASSMEEKEEIKIKINEKGASFLQLREKENVCSLIDQAIERLRNWQ